MHMAAIAVVMIGAGRGRSQRRAAAWWRRAGARGADADRRAAQELCRQRDRRRDRRGGARGRGGAAPRASPTSPVHSRSRPRAATRDHEQVRRPPAKAIPGGHRVGCRGARSARGLLPPRRPETVLSVQDPLSFRVACGAGQRRVPRAGDGRRDRRRVSAERHRRQPDGADRRRHDAPASQLPPRAALAFDALLIGAVHVAMIAERRSTSHDDPLLGPEADARGPGRRGDGRAAPAPRARAVRGGRSAGRAQAPRRTGLDRLPPLDVVEDHGTVGAQRRAPPRAVRCTCSTRS